MSYDYFLFKLKRKVPEAEINDDACEDLGSAADVQRAIESCFSEGVHWRLGNDGTVAWGTLHLPLRFEFSVSTDLRPLFTICVRTGSGPIARNLVLRLCRATGWTAFDGQLPGGGERLLDSDTPLSEIQTPPER